MENVWLHVLWVWGCNNRWIRTCSGKFKSIIIQSNVKKSSHFVCTHFWMREKESKQSEREGDRHEITNDNCTLVLFFHPYNHFFYQIISSSSSPSSASSSFSSHFICIIFCSTANSPFTLFFMNKCTEHTRHICGISKTDHLYLSYSCVFSSEPL